MKGLQGNLLGVAVKQQIEDIFFVHRKVLAEFVINWFRFHSFLNYKFLINNIFKFRLCFIPAGCLLYYFVFISLLVFYFQYFLPSSFLFLYFFFVDYLWDALLRNSRRNIIFKFKLKKQKAKCDIRKKLARAVGKKRAGWKKSKKQTDGRQVTKNECNNNHPRVRRHEAAKVST